MTGEHEQPIRDRAYAIWEEEGRPHGKHLEHWLRAKAEIVSTQAVYCIYTDKEHPISETTPEHIIPLSLGGINAFTVRVQSDFNSTIGHTIDGAIANDPLMKIARAKCDARGHSNQPVTALWKRTTDQHGNPLQVIIHKDGLRVRDLKTARVLSDDEVASLTFTTNLHVDPRERFRFSAKVALGTGYFLFGDVYRTHAPITICGLSLSR